MNKNIDDMIDIILKKNVSYDVESHQYLIDLDKFEYHVCDSEISLYKAQNGIEE